MLFFELLISDITSLFQSAAHLDKSNFFNIRSVSIIGFCCTAVNWTNKIHLVIYPRSTIFLDARIGHQGSTN